MIEFGVWASDEEAFWNSWIAAGICSAPYEFTPEYSNAIQITTQTQGGWTPTKATGNMVTDAFGNEVPERVPVPGWHANVRVSGPLEAEFTYGLAQVDENGNPVNLFDRTWAKEVFGLTFQDADPETKFPQGYRNANGVTYACTTDFSSPSNVWA